MKFHFAESWRRALVAAGLVLGLMSGAALAQVGSAVPNINSLSSMGPGALARIIETAVPMEQLLDEMPRGTPMSEMQAMQLGVPSVSPGAVGPRERARRRMADFGYPAWQRGAMQQSGEVESFAYGSGNYNTIYHYNDYLQVPFPVTYAPWRQVGRLLLSFDGGTTYGTCTAALISRAIIVTAGHCVLDNSASSNGNNGYVTNATFVPAYTQGTQQRFGSCEVSYVVTTSGWAADNALRQGDDVAMGVCSTLSGALWNVANGRQPGVQLGWFGFCYNNCTRPYNFMTQLGYPANYYGGGLMTVSQHLEETAVSGGPDYIYGTGMRGGSSGGPHIQNIGWINDSSSFLGFNRTRNVIMAVTSWGFTDQRIKIGGASPISGPNNSNNAAGLFNMACNQARALHGNASCPLLP
tara:strand:+ start:3412 stop:4641 length:1230 start_codon:yes stop_codon:yes gene_type:complete